MLPKLELHRGSSMEFSSSTMAGIKKVEEGLEEEVERLDEENAQTTTCTCIVGMR